jgi:hypothetical protein
MADGDGSLSETARDSSIRFPHVEEDIVRHRRLAIVGTALLVGTVLPAPLAAQSEKGPYARIAVLRPHDGKTVDFEAGYIRHLEFHRQARDTWAWYGWTVWAGERQRWFVYATFGHSAASLDNPVPPAEDERDNVSNVTPHAEFAGNALYEYLPGLSRGTASRNLPRASSSRPSICVRGRRRRSKRPSAPSKAKLQGETLWYRMVARRSEPALRSAASAAESCPRSSRKE